MQIKYNDRFLTFRPYPGKIERDLLFVGYDESKTVQEYVAEFLIILRDYFTSNIEMSKLTLNEKLFILYTLRSISVSNELKQLITCPKCGKQFNFSVDLDSIIKIKEMSHKHLENIYSEDITAYFKDGQLDNLDLNEFDEIEQYIRDNITKFEFEKKINCVNPECREPLIIDLKNTKVLSTMFSNFNLQNFYRSISILAHFGHIDMSAIMNDLYPFEREMISGVINAEIEKKNKEKRI